LEEHNAGVVAIYYPISHKLDLFTKQLVSQTNDRNLFEQSNNG